jgi:hypothetical protein
MGIISRAYAEVTYVMWNFFIGAIERYASEVKENIVIFGAQEIANGGCLSWG